MTASFLSLVLAPIAIARAFGMLIPRNPVTSRFWFILNPYSMAGRSLT